MNRQSLPPIALALAATSLLAGCPDAPSEDAANNTPAASPPPVVVEMAPPAGSANDVTTTNPAATNEAANSDTEAVAAEVGFGEKGHYDSQDYISVAVSSQFRVQERLTLLRITSNMQQYKAVHGSYPKTEEVFFKEVIDAGGITLPDLPAGQKFGYDPELAAETSAEQSLTILKPK